MYIFTFSFRRAQLSTKLVLHQVIRTCPTRCMICNDSLFHSCLINNIISHKESWGHQAHICLQQDSRAMKDEAQNTQSQSISREKNAHPHKLLRELFTVHGWELIADARDLSQKRIVYNNLTCEKQEKNENERAKTAIGDATRGLPCGVQDET